MSLQPHVSARLAVALLVTLCACDGSAPALAPDANNTAASDGAEEQRLRNPDINLDDTHFAALITSHRQVTGPAPRANSALTVNSPVVYEEYDDHYVEGGYGPEDEVLFGVYWDDPLASPEVASIQTAGDHVSMYGRSGQLLRSDAFHSFMRDLGLPGGNLLEAFFTDASGGGGDPCSVNGTCIESLGPDRGMRVDVEEGEDWREVRTRLTPAQMPEHAAAAADVIEMVRRYRRVPVTGAGAGQQDFSWRPEEISYESRFHTPGGPRTITSRTTIEYLAWHRNIQSDSRRAAHRPRRRSPHQVGSATETHDLQRGARLAHSAGTGGAGACARGASEVNRTVVAGGQSVVYQHGICSEASTWDGMRPRLAAELEVGQERAFSLTSLARLSDQATQLEQKLVNTGAGSSIVIGHSQGGLIARKLGQRRNDLVNGVIAIGSPHAGALIADLAPGEASMDVHSAMGAYCFGNFMCGLTNNLSAGVDDGRVSYGLTVTVPPVVQDVRTNSAFLDTLNTSYEPFMRASIQVDAGNRWAAMRLVGDLLSERERLLDGHAPKGRDWVADTEDLYRGAIAFMSLAMFIKWYVAPSVGCGHSGYIHYWPPCYDAHYGNYWYESSYWNQLADILFNVGFIVATALNAVDQTWDFLTTRHSDRTDGFIQYSSQRYPPVPGATVPERYIVRGGDSHTGETASPPVFDRLRRALLDMGMTTP